VVQTDSFRFLAYSSRLGVVSGPVSGTPIYEVMLKSLVEAVTRATDGMEESVTYTTVVEGVTLLRSDHERSPNLVIYRPALCVVLQGSKRTLFGDLDFLCLPGEAVLVGVATPGLGRVIQASLSEPYLGIVLEIDMATLREVLEEVEAPAPSDDVVRSGIFRVDFSAELADCALRLLRLADTPRAIPMLAPAIMREICYWLLTGPCAAEVCRLARLSGPTRAIVDSIRVLRERFAEPLRVEELARSANMSPSAFHLRFKALTATSPLQFQKQLRLHEARRLLIAGEANVEAAAFQVGYVSPSQFSREYSRTFWFPPRKDAVLAVASR